MKNIPDKIFLQVNPENEEAKNFKNLEGITWSTEREFKTDIEYNLSSTSVSTVSEESIREIQKEYFQANPSSDYFFSNTDEAYHKGIEMGIWGALRSRLFSERQEALPTDDAEFDRTFKGLADFIKDKDILQWYYDLIKLWGVEKSKGDKEAILKMIDEEIDLVQKRYDDVGTDDQYWKLMAFKSLRSRLSNSQIKDKQ